ncbi:MauE/DoxX family redox-associated membrane protein [Chitinophaga sp. YIM B06452]|uniref:MauE/DoxX family redox-associated membrane protein n=1 Tax=Chitinophaga sp. YIM B06452 TaxID=3082158 RepID=UPI0031FF102E
MKKNFIEGISALLVMLFVYAALSKVADVKQFKIDMYNQPFPKWISSILLWVVPGGELLIAAALLWSRARIYGLWGSALLMGAFTIYTATVLMNAFGKIPCSCGGVIKHLSWSQHLILNVFFLLLSITGLFLLKRKPGNKFPLDSKIQPG